MIFNQCFLTKNDCYKAGRKLTPSGIMVHSTGANNPNVNRYVPVGDKYSSLNWNRSGLQKCVHGFLGKMPDGTVDFVQTLPFTMRGWHSGPNSKAGCIAANNTHIGFECCEDNLQNKEYFELVYKKAVEVCAEICREFNLNPLKDGVIISHHEGHLRGVASNHGDIDHWFKIYRMTMDDFRRDVANIMRKGDEFMNKSQFSESMEEYRKSQSELPYSDWAEDEEVAIRIAKTGISDGSRPRDFASREEVFAMMLRLETRLVEMFGKE